MVEAEVRLPGGLLVEVGIVGDGRGRVEISLRCLEAALEERVEARSRWQAEHAVDSLLVPFFRELFLRLAYREAGWER